MTNPMPVVETCNSDEMTQEDMLLMDEYYALVARVALRMYREAQAALVADGSAAYVLPPDSEKLIQETI
jgi:hypothetical protein